MDKKKNRKQRKQKVISSSKLGEMGQKQQKGGFIDTISQQRAKINISRSGSECVHRKNLQGPRDNQQHEYG